MSLPSMDWMDAALCRNLDPEVFFPTGVGVVGRRQAEDAKRICGVCPVQLECRDYKQRFSGACGVWGGRYKSVKNAVPSAGGPHRKGGSRAS